MVTPVTVTLGFDTLTSLSKVFIDFTSQLPSQATLEFYQESSSMWVTLQQYALDCSTAFGVSPNVE